MNTTSPLAGGPLEGMVVIDLTRALAGPLATLILAGLGATVIKVEDPSGGDSARTNAPYFGADGLTMSKRLDSDMALAILNRCRGKGSVTLDLKKSGAQEIFFDLVRGADVVVENFSTGTAGRLGVGYEQVRTVNERVIYCSISGFGQDAQPGVRAMDAVIQAMSGIMLASGAPDDPPIRVGVPVADGVSPLYAVIGILAALQNRERTGRGQQVDVSMLGVLTALVAIEDWDALERLGQPVRTGPTLPRLAPFGLFRCRDGYVAIVAPQDKMAHDLLRAIGRHELVDDPRFATRDGRVIHHHLIDEVIESWTGARPLAEVVSVLQGAGVSAAPVRSPSEGVRDPGVVARGETLPVIHPTLGEISGLRTAGLPIRFSEHSTGFSRPAPDLGADNDAVYGGLLGYSEERLAELRHTGVI
jgi:CoA:oxalate CoA-transferase